MKRGDISIRNASPEDVEMIFDFICELAVYEKLRDDVTATPDILMDLCLLRDRPRLLLLRRRGEHWVLRSIFTIFPHSKAELVSILRTYL